MGGRGGGGGGSTPGFDPLSLFTGGLASSIFGTKQLGGVAPTPDFGGGGQLDTSIGPEGEAQSPELAALLQQLFSAGGEQTGVVGEAVGALPPPIDTPSVQANDVPDFFREGSTPQETPSFLSGLGEKAGGFFGNLDENLQSPSKVIGMGLLGQIDPRLGYGGLLASGLFGKNKLFGG